MNYGNAMVLDVEELAPFRIERAEVVRHARWDAAPEVVRFFLFSYGDWYD